MKRDVLFSHVHFLHVTPPQMAAPVAKNKKSHVTTLAFDHWV